MRFSQWVFCLSVGGIAVLSEIASKAKSRIPQKELFVYAGLLFGSVPSCDIRMVIPTAVFVSGFALLHFSAGWLAFGIGCAPVALQLSSFPFPGFAFVEMWYPLYLRGIFFTSIAMWLENLGFFAFFAIVVCWFWLDKNQIKIYLPGMSVFLLCNYCRFQAESRLNFVVLYPLWIVPAVVAVATSFRKMVASSSDSLAQGAVCGYCVLFVVLCTLSGVLGARKQLGQKTKIWTDGQSEIARWITASSNMDAGFTGNCSEIAFVAVLTGRPVGCVEHPEHFGLGSGSGPGANLQGIDYAIGTAPVGWALAYSSGSTTIYQRP
jgi:hypothetical protein